MQPNDQLRNPVRNLSSTPLQNQGDKFAKQAVDMAFGKANKLNLVGLFWRWS